MIGEDWYAEGRALKQGKQVICNDAPVTNEPGKQLARGTVIYRIIEREEG